MSFFNIIYSYYFNLYLNLDSYIYSLFISLLFGILFLFKKKDQYKISIYQKIITVILGYLFLPILISIPYYLSIYNISFIDGYFESISGFTSTGFSIFDNIKHLDESMILWRSSSQWIGGLYFLFSIILLIDIFDTNLKKSLTNFLSLNLAESLRQYLKISILYLSLTFFIFLILNFTGLRVFDSFNLSMTIISSGGFLPVNNLSEIINTNTKEIILSFLMFLSFFSLYLSYNLLTIKKNINFYQEDFYLFIYLFIIIFLIYYLDDINNNFSTLLLSISSSISNIGFTTEGSYEKISFFLLIFTIIGGSFFSTSSGLRFVKLYSLFVFAKNELISHARPKEVYITKLKFSNSKFEVAEVNKFFLSILIFLISLIFLSFLLSIYGINFENSFKLSILTLMNTVNSSMHSLDLFSFQDLQYQTKYLLILFMIIGRVELLTIFIIFKKFFFNN
ncbi:TrkH family potassium uptake protein [Candidatus Pelagibacter sp.]|nr:TrkH family potassium uptake protein [Candidatus Pelagibacter sp.]